MNALNHMIEARPEPRESLPNSAFRSLGNLFTRRISSNPDGDAANSSRSLLVAGFPAHRPGCGRKFIYPSIASSATREASG